MNPAKVRIVMPVYNYADYVALGIESVLGQTEPDWKLWIVDDGSSDATPDICRRYEQQDSRIHFIQQPNGGQYGIVNRYCAEGEAKYNVVLDGDDQLSPDYIAAMYQFAEKYHCDVLLTTHQTLQKKHKLRYMHPRYIHQRAQQVFVNSQEKPLVLQYLHGAFSMPASGIFSTTALRCKIAPQMPELPLYAATDDLQGFFLAQQAQCIGHIGAAKYQRNLGSSGTWRNITPEFRLRKVYSILFSLNCIQHNVAQWPQQQGLASNYMMRWLRYSLLCNFSGLNQTEQFFLLQAAVRKVHEYQEKIFISPKEQMAYLADMPPLPQAESFKQLLRRFLLNLLPYGYVQHKKGNAPTSALNSQGGFAIQQYYRYTAGDLTT